VSKSGAASEIFGKSSLKICDDGIVIAQLIPSRATNHAARLQPKQPRTRHKNAVAMVGRSRVSRPSQRLSQRPIGICRLPTTGQIELVGQAIEYIAFGAWNLDGLGRLSISDGNVEVAAEHKIGMAAKQADAVKNVLHRADVSAFTNGSMNAENDYRTLRPRDISDFASNHPAFVSGNWNGY
jgi:hypothetical protein